MPKANATLAADLQDAPAHAAPRGEAILIDLDDVAARRQRLAAYAQATGAVIVYRFAIRSGARVSALAGGERDARAQLDLIVGLTGGAVAKTPDGVAARIPLVLAGKFEALAGPLVAAYLVALDLGEAVRVGAPRKRQSDLGAGVVRTVQAGVQPPGRRET